ncbi:MAG: hypothetical protein HGA50_18300, partial [Deltaproteobacteria bacterium]|nr:hypothetical protein [Deltaproteobacteria bacterium]
MMPKIRFLLVGTALLLLIGACATAGKDPLDRLSAEQLQQMGEKYLAAGNIAQALRFLTMAHEKKPN